MSQTPSEEYDQKKNKVCIIEFFTIMYYIPTYIHKIIPNHLFKTLFLCHDVNILGTTDNGGKYKKD